jgi:cation diffusion facilitator family transporter
MAGDHDHAHHDHDHDDHAVAGTAPAGTAGHGVGHLRGHGHRHGSVTGEPGAIRVVLLSSLVLGAVAAVELGAAVVSGSAAVLADGLHNLADVFTSAALATAFLLSRRAPTRRFPYGYHRGEDLAGLGVLMLIVVSAVAAGVTSLEHLLHPAPLTHPVLAIAVALVGVVGNAMVARYKTTAGRRLHSVALVADGQHSRIDALVSVGAVVGVGGAAAGMPMLDPLVGLLLTLVIAAVAWETARTVTGRLLDEADASLVDTIARVAAGVPGVVEVSHVRARWAGRRVWAEVTLSIPPEEPLGRAHALGEEVAHRLHHDVGSLADVIVHLDPAGDAAAHEAVEHHRTAERRPEPPLPRS